MALYLSLKVLASIPFWPWSSACSSCGPGATILHTPKRGKERRIAESIEDKKGKERRIMESIEDWRGEELGL